MLTLKAPIQLNSTRGFLTAGEGFCRRLTENYGLLTARITPKDLLFYMAAPPELPEELGGMTTIRFDNSLTDQRSITMEVVNHVVNRILLDGSSHFTYQDQVYITTMLQRLGITDVQQFMTEVRHLREQTQTQSRQLHHYQREVARLLTGSRAPEEAAVPRPAGSAAPGEARPLPPVRYFLHDDIYHRLETGAIYETVNAFQQDQTRLETSLHRQELRTAEQLRVSRQLTLQQLREHSRETSALVREENRYVVPGAPLPPAPKSEEQVLAQAAAATLLHAVDQVLVQQLTRRITHSDQWLQLGDSFSQTAENALFLYENQYTQTPPGSVVNLYHREGDRQAFYEETVPEAPLLRMQDSPRSQPPLPRPTGESPIQLWQQNETVEFVDAPQPLPPRTQEEAAEEAAASVQRLREIEQHNRERYERLQEQLLLQQLQPQPPAMPDRARTLESALRSLEDPAALLRELTAAPAPTEHPRYAPQIEAILSQADEATRTVFEQVMLYQQDPQAALAGGILKPAAPGNLLGDVARIEQEQAEMVHRMQEQTTDTVIRQLPSRLVQELTQPQPPPRSRRDPQQPPPGIAFVHKQEQTAFTEELLERLEQKTAQQTTQVTESHQTREQRLHETQVNEVSRQVVTQSTEDITQLINRTLSKQMGAISDQVYRQMEKRLQTERSRRGRF